MKRYKIWEKGDFFSFIGDPKRIDMDPAVVELPNEPIALAFGFIYNKPGDIVGHVSDIKLEDGEITCVIDESSRFSGILDEMFEYYRLGGYYTKVFKNDDGTQVLSCRLQAVGFRSVLSANANMPGFPEIKEIGDGKA